MSSLPPLLQQQTQCMATAFLNPQASCPLGKGGERNRELENTLEKYSGKNTLEKYTGRKDSFVSAFPDSAWIVMERTLCARCYTI